MSYKLIVTFLLANVVFCMGRYVLWRAGYITSDEDDKERMSYIKQNWKDWLWIIGSVWLAGLILSFTPVHDFHILARLGIQIFLGWIIYYIGIRVVRAWRASGKKDE